MRLDEMDLALERDVFLRSLIRELSGVLEDAIGSKEGSGFVSVVRRSIGEWVNGEYRKACAFQSKAAFGQPNSFSSSRHSRYFSEPGKEQHLGYPYR